MLEHISIGVSDLARARAFYDAVLATLGYVRLFSNARGVGYGTPGAGYYAAFARDVDGYRVEAVCHE